VRFSSSLATSTRCGEESADQLHKGATSSLSEFELLPKGEEASFPV